MFNMFWALWLQKFEYLWVESVHKIRGASLFTGTDNCLFFCDEGDTSSGVEHLQWVRPKICPLSCMHCPPKCVQTFKNGL